MIDMKFYVQSFTLVPLLAWCVLSIACQNQLTTQSTILDVETRADQLIITAWGHESTVTKLLQDLSQKFHAQLRGLEHRLKTRSSTIRKLKKVAKEDPKLKIAELMISDVLRYTFEIKDDPVGHYVQSTRELLNVLAKEGYQAKKIKNYWPKGDNYSGVNMVLIDAKGFEWELQIHTPASLAESKRSHTMYEKLRSNKTPLEERQALFEKMSAPWNEITIPKDVLVPKSLHEIEVIKSMNKPSK
jgi:hypothetical protein